MRSGFEPAAGLLGSRRQLKSRRQPKEAESPNGQN